MGKRIPAKRLDHNRQSPALYIAKPPRRNQQSTGVSITQALAAASSVVTLMGCAASASAGVGRYLLNWVVGQYGVMNNCLGSALGCLQMYAQSNGTVLSMGRNIESSRTGVGGVTDMIMTFFMKKGFGVEQMANLYEQALASGGVADGEICSLPSSAFGSIQVLGQAVGLNNAACNAAKSLFSTLAREAHADAMGPWGGIVAGGVLFGVVAIVVGVALGCCKNRGHSHSCHSRPSCA